MDVLARILRQPLVSFALIGVLVFALDRGLGGASSQAPERIELTTEIRAQLGQRFEARHGRAPSPDEERALMDEFVRDEIMVREALTLGLDRGDPVIRRRLIQRLEFLAEDLAQVEPPSEADLAAYLAAHRARYLEPARVTLDQVFIRQGEDATERARLALEHLRAGAAHRSLGDPFPHGAALVHKSERQIEALMGQSFADAVMSAPVSSWHGPVASSYGVHLVRVREHVPEHLPTVDDIRQRVERDLLAEARARAARAWIDGLRARYQVIDGSSAEPGAGAP